MQKVLQHLLDLLTKHLSSEDNACLGQVGAARAHRGLPAGASAADRAPDAAEASLGPLSGTRVGACAQRSVGHTSTSTSIRIPRS